MSAFEADRFNHSRTSPEQKLSVISCQSSVKSSGPLPSRNDQRLTTLPKKLLQDVCRTSGQYPAPDVHLMIQTGVIHHLQNRMDGACLRVIGTVGQGGGAGMHWRCPAHGARLNSSKQFEVDEPVVTDVSSRLAE